MTEEMLVDARNNLHKYWGESADAVILACDEEEKFNGSTDDFLNHCVCCGGNWAGMFLTGIRDLWPNVWNVIPDDMGDFAFPAICYVLQLCGVDTSK